MKSLKKTIHLAFLLCFCISALACRDELASPADVLLINDSDIIGRWRIDKFIAGAIDESAEFAGVTVSFEQENKFTIFKNNTKVNDGFWRIRLNKNELAINVFNGTDPYDEFDADWYVTKKDANTLWILNSNSLGKEEFRMSR
jgi:hypothetical protein